MKKETVIVRRRNLKAEKRRMLLRCGTTLLLIIFSIVIFASVFTSDASEDLGRMKYYTSVRIEAGDSLWSITDTYMTDDYKDRSAYMQELCTLNHLMPDAMIHEGEYVVVPYYAEIQ